MKALTASWMLGVLSFYEPWIWVEERLSYVLSLAKNFYEAAPAPAFSTAAQTSS